MRIQHIALVSEDHGPSTTDLALVASALQQQITRHVAPLWNVAGTVQPFPALDDVPLGYWPLVVTGRPLGANAGIHRDDNNQPYAQIAAGPLWSLTASSLCLEMLVNPGEDRTVVGPSPRNHGALGEFLVEVCGPCDPKRGYVIRDVVVSDFCTPAFFGLQLTPHCGYSVNGSVDAPLQLGKSGHLTWRDPATGSWWLRNHWNESPVDTQLGPIDRRVVSLRAFVQACQDGLAAPPGSSWDTRAAQYRSASRVRAERLRALPPTRFEPDLQSAVAKVRRRKTLRYGEPSEPVPPPSSDESAASPAPAPPSAAAEIEARAISVAPELASIMFDLSVASPKTHDEVAPAAAPSTIAPPPEPVEARRESFATPPLPLRDGQRSSSVPPVARTLPPRARKPQSAVRRAVPLVAGAVLLGALLVVSFQAGHDTASSSPHTRPAAPPDPAPAPPPLASTSSTTPPPTAAGASASLDKSAKAAAAPRARRHASAAPAAAADQAREYDIEALIDTRR